MASFKRLNYQHLLYLWTVIRTGSLSEACEELKLSAPTVSVQLKTLEERLGEKLLVRQGRRLVPTEAGRLVYSYADEIFGLGQDLVEALEQRPTRRPMRLVVGIDDVLPKEIAARLLEPALSLEQQVRLTCREGTLERLAAQLDIHEVDVVLSDAPITPSLHGRAYNHRLGACGVCWVAAAPLAKKLRAGFPKSLQGAPVLLPTDDTDVRRSLDQWLEKHGLRPLVVGEFEDYGLLREFARGGRGVAPVPDVLQEQFLEEYGLALVGAARGVEAHFYAVSLEKRIRHPAVLAIAENGRALFGASRP